MKNSFVALFVGFLFALGLGISGMTQPEKVMGFLDIFGAWDPSLIFVMAGAIAVHFIIYKIVQKRSAPLLDVRWHLPTKREITRPLLAGAFLFGIGWGLAGYCPGPALVALAKLDISVLIFVASMISGMFLFKMSSKRLGLN